MQESHTVTSLLTIGEHCIELICAQLAHEDLSRLSQTCWLLHNHVCRLPPKFDRTPHCIRSLPKGCTLSDVAYWSFQGVIWKVDDASELVDGTERMEQGSMMDDCFSKNSTNNDSDNCNEGGDDRDSGGEVFEMHHLLSEYKIKRLNLLWDSKIPVPMACIPALGSVYSLDLSYCKFESAPVLDAVFEEAEVVEHSSSNNDDLRLEDMASYSPASDNAFPKRLQGGRKLSVRNFGNPLFSNLHSLTLTACDKVFDVEAIRRIHTLNLSYCDWVTDVSFFSSVHTLNLTHCDNIVSSTVTHLGSVHNLTLSECRNVEHISGLRTCHTLNLSKCMYLPSDLSPLKNVRSLNLSSSEVSNVSTLKNVHTLDLSLCKFVVDVSGLGAVHTLDLSGCEWFMDASALGRVHTLSLSGTEVSDVSALGNVHCLDLSYCSCLTDVSPLHSVHFLDLSNCEELEDVSSLVNVYKLVLTFNSSITDVSALGHTFDLNLSRCKNVRDVSALARVSHLNLSYCQGISDISALLNHVDVLDITGCTNIVVDAMMLDTTA
eukprot:m.9608 g.9608  ORF g.9608 m.9608 type:complete len:546 (-) comp3498_c0_seq1:313-1950(-)